jgi:hypothetical protein
MFNKPKREVDRVFIHCTASSNPRVTVKDIDQWHKERGWSGIGYHFFIDTAGKLNTGRNIESTPAAQAGNNTGTIAICLNGNVVKDFNEKQFETLRQFCIEINDAYDDITFHGHCEVSTKTCPVFDYKAVLKLDKDGYLGL